MRWQIVCVFIPFIIVSFSLRKYLFLYKRTLFAITIASLIGVALFDIIDLNFLHIYFFNPMQNLGITVLGVPLEEYIATVFSSVGISLLFLACRNKLLYGKI